MPVNRKHPKTPKDIPVTPKDQTTPGKIPGFLRKCVLGEMQKVELRHVLDGGEQRVERFPLKGPDGEWVNVDALASEIISVAENEADAKGGYQCFAVYAFDKMTDLQAVGRRLFTVKHMGAGLELDDTSPREEVSERGVNALLMRHIEARERTAAGMFSDSINVLLTLVKDANERAEHYQERHFETIQLAEELHGKQFDREQAVLKEQRLTRIWDKGLETASLLIPVVANRALGAPKKKATGEEVLKKFLYKIAGQKEKLVRLGTEVFAMEEMAALGELAKTFQNGGGDSAITENIVTQILRRIADENKLGAIMKILSHEEMALFAQLFQLYADKEAGKAPAPETGSTSAKAAE